MGILEKREGILEKRLLTLQKLSTNMKSAEKFTFHDQTQIFMTICQKKANASGCKKLPFCLNGPKSFHHTFFQDFFAGLLQMYQIFLSYVPA